MASNVAKYELKKKAPLRGAFLQIFMGLLNGNLC